MASMHAKYVRQMHSDGGMWFHTTAASEGRLLPTAATRMAWGQELGLRHRARQHTRQQRFGHKRMVGQLTGQHRFGHRRKAGQMTGQGRWKGKASGRAGQMHYR